MRLRWGLIDPRCGLAVPSFGKTAGVGLARSGRVVVSEVVAGNDCLAGRFVHEDAVLVGLE
jgi:hypothetical protein